MADEAQVAGQEAQPKVAGTKKPVLIGAVAGTVVVGAAVGFMVVGPMVSPSSGGAEHDSAAVGQADGDHGGDHGEAAAGAGSVHVIDNMVLNPAMTSGARFLLVATAIELTDPALSETLKARDAEARDVLISVLGARTVEQLSDLAHRDSLRSEIASAFNTMLAKPKAVRRVYFPQFVVQ